MDNLAFKNTETSAASPSSPTHQMPPSAINQVQPIAVTPVLSTSVQTQGAAPAQAKSFKCLGSLQVGIGVGCILIQILANVLDAYAIAAAGVGYWSGIWFILTGSFGITAGFKHPRGFVITFLVLSTLSVPVALTAVTATSVGIHYSSGYNCYGYSDCDASIALNAILLVCAIVETVVAVVSFGICCYVLCCRKTTVQTYPNQYLVAQGAAPAKANSFKCFGSLQLVSGVCSIIIQIVANVFAAQVIAETGAGYWSGPLFILAGSFGITAGFKHHPGFVITFLVLSTLSAPVALGVVTATSVGIVYSDDYYGCRWFHNDCDASIALNASLLVCAIVEAVVAVVSFGICCYVLCCRKTTAQTYPNQYLGAQVQYLPTGTQQVFVQPNGQLMLLHPGIQRQNCAQFDGQHHIIYPGGQQQQQSILPGSMQPSWSPGVAYPYQSYPAGETNTIQLLGSPGSMASGAPPAYIAAEQPAERNPIAPLPDTLTKV